MSEALDLAMTQTIGAREEQQDSCATTGNDDAAFVQHGGILAVVADGVGGHAFGGGASQTAVSAFIKDYLGKPREMAIPDALFHALQAANHAVYEFAEGMGVPENCGTTLVAAAIHPASRSLYWIGVGDSRLYLLRGRQWVQLTADANCAGERIKRIARGTLSPEESMDCESLQALTSYLGLKKLHEVDKSIRGFPLHADDRLLLCTDGIYNALEEMAILAWLRAEPRQACDGLMQSIKAKNLPNQDNATAAVIAFEPTYESPPVQATLGETGPKPPVQETLEPPIEKNPMRDEPSKSEPQAEPSGQKPRFKLLMWISIVSAASAALWLGARALLNS